MTVKDFLKEKKVLVAGLGTLGGGVATTRWLVKHGAEVTVTDLQTRDSLSKSIQSLGSVKKQVRFVLGRHQEEDFRANDMVVVNPAVPLSSPYIQAAREAGVSLENELTLFLRFCKNPVVGVTGTRGKTTTATWVHYFLKCAGLGSVLTGNTAQHAMLEVLDNLDDKSPVVAELSSFQLELLPEIERSPHIAVVTNIYPDHLNRHKTIERYVGAKVNICRYQNKNDTLIAKKEDEWTPQFTRAQKRGEVLFYDTAKLGIEVPGSFPQTWGQHNKENLQAAVLTAHTAGVSWGAMQKVLGDLPVPRFRQQEIYNKNGVRVINDATATTPEAGIAALKRFSADDASVVLIAGGTDKGLSYENWADIVQQEIAPEHLVLLEGSATKKMQAALSDSYMKNVSVCSELSECVEKALSLAHTQDQAVVLFSPAGTSFEKFSNEFDRGEQFTQYIEKSLNVPQ